MGVTPFSGDQSADHHLLRWGSHLFRYKQPLCLLHHLPLQQPVEIRIDINALGLSFPYLTIGFSAYLECGQEESFEVSSSQVGWAGVMASFWY